MMSEEQVCCECGTSVAWGSGWFVNRIPCDDGWLCRHCAGSDCDICGERIYVDEEEAFDGMWMHYFCAIEQGYIEEEE
tara:strand:- start:8702 stop:8935 length:234 start_codon:yes stop_codon:yes gene_type:complete